eukprot:2689363-Pyramimonas_sp.AAC.1
MDVHAGALAMGLEPKTENNLAAGTPVPYGTMYRWRSQRRLPNGETELERLQRLAFEESEEKRIRKRAKSKK